MLEHRLMLTVRLKERGAVHRCRIQNDIRDDRSSHELWKIDIHITARRTIAVLSLKVIAAEAELMVADR